MRVVGQAVDDGYRRMLGEFEQPRVIGSYDTYPGASGGFNGAWGAYIFPASNLIVASDISGGLFVIAYTGQ